MWVMTTEDRFVNLDTVDEVRLDRSETMDGSPEFKIVTLRDGAASVLASVPPGEDAETHARYLLAEVRNLLASPQPLLDLPAVYAQLIGPHDPSVARHLLAGGTLAAGPARR